MKSSSRKKQILRQADKLAESRDHWIEKNSFFYKNDHSYMQFLVGDGKRVLELGCGTGQLLNALNPSYGIGVDLSANMISVAQQNHPSLEFIQGDLEDEDFISSLQGPFDFIILSDTIGYLEDCENALEGLHSLCTPDTRLIISYYL